MTAPHKLQLTPDSKLSSSGIRSTGTGNKDKVRTVQDGVVHIEVVDWIGLERWWLTRGGLGPSVEPRCGPDERRLFRMECSCDAVYTYKVMGV